MSTTTSARSGATRTARPTLARGPGLRARNALHSRLRALGGGGDDVGMATAEYAIATVAAAGFAGLLITLLRSDEVRGLLMTIVRGALSV